MKKSDFLKRVKKDYDLSNHTTYKIGGKAKYFIELGDGKDVISFLEFCKNNNLNYFILGGGSNVLFSDEGFDGLVIRVVNNDIKFNENFVVADAGVSLQDIVQKSAGMGLSGLEYLAGIPGSVGGAIRGNAGAYGHEVSDIVESVNVIVEKDGEYILEKLSNDDLMFSYRNSIIKEKEYIVLGAVLKLKKSTKEMVQEIVRDVIEERNSKQPYEYPSAGCVFKNITSYGNKDLKKFEVYNKVPVAKIIEELGFKGKHIGGATVSEKHSNFVINTGNAKSSDVKKLIKEIKDKALEKYGVKLEEEIKIVG